MVWLCGLYSWDKRFFLIIHYNRIHCYNGITYQKKKKKFELEFELHINCLNPTIFYCNQLYNFLLKSMSWFGLQWLLILLLLLFFFGGGVVLFLFYCYGWALVPFSLSLFSPAWHWMLHALIISISNLRMEIYIIIIGLLKNMLVKFMKQVIL